MKPAARTRQNNKKFPLEGVEQFNNVIPEPPKSNHPRGVPDVNTLKREVEEDQAQFKRGFD